MQSASSELNILLLSDGSWDRTVRLAAASMYDVAVHQVRSLPAAMAQLASRPPVDCVLVQAGCCTDAARQLAALAGNSRQSPEMIILGRDLDPPPNARMLPEADVHTLSRLLASLDLNNADADRRRLPRDDVPGALKSGKLHMRYQPMVTIADRRAIAVEALARLDHPVLGMLTPAQFVPQMEMAGLARQLTDAVLDTAMADYRRHLHGLGLSLSLNIPLEVLRRPDLVEWLELRREKAGLAAANTIIELTESQPVALLTPGERHQLRTAMHGVRRLGYRIAIDDFGPEIPELQALFGLPFDLLKLDKAVVNSPGQAPLIAACIKAGRGAFKVLAEGVEDEETWTRMEDLGVHYVQGFLVSRPVPPQNVAELVDEWRGRH